MDAAEKSGMIQVIIDIFDAISYVMNGAPADPKRHARTPPSGWWGKRPEADVPKRKAQAVEVDLNAYTPEEILAMSEAEFRQKVGLQGIETYQDAQKQARKQVNKKNRGGNAKPVEIEL